MHVAAPLFAGARMKPTLILVANNGDNVAPPAPVVPVPLMQSFGFAVFGSRITATVDGKQMPPGQAMALLADQARRVVEERESEGGPIPGGLP